MMHTGKYLVTVRQWNLHHKTHKPTKLVSGRHSQLLSNEHEIAHGSRICGQRADRSLYFTLHRWLNYEQGHMWPLPYLYVQHVLLLTAQLSTNVPHVCARGTMTGVDKVLVSSRMLDCLAWMMCAPCTLLWSPYVQGQLMHRAAHQRWGACDAGLTSAGSHMDVCASKADLFDL